MYDKITLDFIKKLSVRQIAIEAKIDRRTVSKYISGKPVLYIKEKKIKKAIVDLLAEHNKLSINF